MLSFAEVKKVLNLKKEQSLARVQHDAVLNDLIVLQKRNDSEKIANAQKLCVEAKERYPYVRGILKAREKRREHEGEYEEENKREASCNALFSYFLFFFSFLF